MANRLATLLGNAKTRTLVLLVVGVLIFGVVIAVSQSDSPNATAVTERVSKTTAVPSQVKSTPGEQVSRRYQELQEKANVRGAEKAAEKGDTFIPTLTGSAEGYDDTDFKKQLSAAFDDLGGKCSKEEVDRLRSEGMSSTQAICYLKSYGCSAAAISSLFTCDEITGALIAAKDCIEADTGGCTGASIQAMKKLDYSASQVAKQLIDNGCTPDAIAKLMKEEGYSYNEIAKGLNDAGVNIDAIVKALKSAGADATEIAGALDAAGYDRGEILAALRKSGFSASDIARAISSLDLEGADSAAMLAQQQASADEAARLAAQREAQRLAQFSQQRQSKIQELVAAMESQKATAFQTWEAVEEQEYIEGEWGAVRPSVQEQIAAGTVTVAGRPTNANAADAPQGVILKAGSILFAVLDTAVNSDEPGPVMATIVAGSLKGSKLMGTMATNIDAENIALNFSAINMPNEASSMGISAVAIDPDTARTALVSDVDHHYLLRWGSLFAASFMEGYASAVASAGQTQSVSQGAAGTTTTTTSPPLSGRQQLFEGLAAFGTKWSEVVGRNFDTPITITIGQGTGIGVLITADLKYGTDPIYYTPATAATTTETPAQPASPEVGITIEQASALLKALGPTALQTASALNTAPNLAGTTTTTTTGGT